MQFDVPWQNPMHSCATMIPKKELSSPYLKYAFYPLGIGLHNHPLVIDIPLATTLVGTL
jgi:hypothetical protein